jgi:hypothetical protein
LRFLYKKALFIRVFRSQFFTDTLKKEVVKIGCPILIFQPSKKFMVKITAVKKTFTAFIPRGRLNLTILVTKRKNFYTGNLESG